ncbi:MAG: hypothetical protein HC906_01885 [Bacteroidales bacterium]|nr:hypothetical protein [Bacteroidales bacterium]
MIKRIFLTILVPVLLFYCSLNGQVNVIFDTDFGGDADDLGALTMLHHFINRGECNLLGIMCWSNEKYAVPAIDAINRFHHHNNIPIGVRKDGDFYEPWNYSKPIADKHYHKLDYTLVPDATELYRKILSKSEDKSVVVVTVGPLRNIENLIRSQADVFSPLSGKELINNKVKEFVIMGGKYPSGEKEWNFDGNMPGVTKFVIENIKVPITFSGFELGVLLKSGEEFNKLDINDPLYIGFMHFSENAPWMKEYFKGKILDNSSYDQTAVLYAVRNGEGIYWTKVKDGLCIPDDKGGNTWIPEPGSNHSYLVLKMDAEKLAQEIENMMLNQF